MKGNRYLLESRMWLHSVGFVNKAHDYSDYSMAVPAKEKQEIECRKAASMKNTVN